MKGAIPFQSKFYVQRATGARPHRRQGSPGLSQNARLASIGMHQGSDSAGSANRTAVRPAAVTASSGNKPFAKGFIAEHHDTTTARILQQAEVMQSEERGRNGAAMPQPGQTSSASFEMWCVGLQCSGHTLLAFTTRP